ncbi:MAG: Ran-binding protein 10 [Paramarteilia canceri]
MAIGMSPITSNLSNLPGWEPDTYGYHGDDGNAFICDGKGSSYGPTYTSGDVIGCGVNFIDNVCFFTKNGCHLGNVMKDFSKSLYPTVGMRYEFTKMMVNFGQEEFDFKIADYFQVILFSFLE